jgi:hypothetical protein
VVSRAADGRAKGSAAEISAGRLAEILLEGIRTLARAGEVEAACRLAGQACVALRTADPSAARRFDAVLHRLTSKLTW